MLPNVYGFSWTPGHLIFLGLFFTVVLVILTTVSLAVFRVLRDMRAKRLDRIRWTAEFHDLPGRDRVCRHEIAGDVPRRTCDQGFDCRICATHARLAAQKPPVPAQDTNPFGMEFPDDRRYHRGHAWVKEEADGTFTVGLDDFARRLIGEPDEVELPRPGEKLETNGPGWKMRRNGVEVRVLAPVDGKVIETGGPGAGFYLEIRPDGARDTRHLLRGSEVRPWIEKELERLQLLMSAKDGMPALADGGILVDDVPKSAPAANWDTIWGELFLEP